MKYNLDEVKADPLVLTIGGKDYSVKRMITGSVLTLTKKFEKDIKRIETVGEQYERSVEFVRQVAPSIPEDVLRTLDMVKFQKLSQVVMSYHYGEVLDGAGGSGNPEPAPKGGDEKK